jgi:hypothetical protein
VLRKKRSTPALQQFGMHQDRPDTGDDNDCVQHQVKCDDPDREDDHFAEAAHENRTQDKQQCQGHRYRVVEPMRH